jgi:uncharacterized membrane protein YtjA (UPF0391 family)
MHLPLGPPFQWLACKPALARVMLRQSVDGGIRAGIGRPTNPIVRCRMLRYAAIFFVIALVAALFGFGGIAAGAVEIAKVLFFIFLVLFLVSLVWGLVSGRGP